MSYFERLPDIDYPNILDSRTSDNSRTLVKNIFRRVKLRDDIANNITLFDAYEIKNDDRPDVVANEVYGNSELDWLVLISNGITSIRDQWPLNSVDIYNFSVEKYGLDGINEIGVYETTEVRDSLGRLIMPSGLLVDSDFTITDPENYSITLNPVAGISNYELEIRKNDEKRSIQLLRPEYVNIAIRDIEERLEYSLSTQYVSPKLLKSDIVRLFN